MKETKISNVSKVSTPAESHIRIHSAEKYVLSIDIDTSPRRVINHILELQEIVAAEKAAELAGRFDIRNPELMPEVETNE